MKGMREIGGGVRAERVASSRSPGTQRARRAAAVLRAPGSPGDACERSFAIRRQRGWGATEYLAVLLGLLAAWRGAQAVLALVREHHDEFSWALMIPF